MNFKALSLLSAVLWLTACQQKPTEPARAPVAPPPPTAPVAVAVAAPAEKPALGSFGVELGNMKRSIAPGDDFYGYVNGAWLDSYQLKEDESRYGSFIALRYASEEQVRVILDGLTATKPAPGTIEQKISDFFASFMAVEAASQLGITALRPELEAIRAIKSQTDLSAAFGKSQLMESSAPMDGDIEVDRNDPDRYMLTIAHSGLGLPDRDYYLEDTFKAVRDAYQLNIATVLGFTGLAPAESKAAAANILELETKIAKLHWPRTELRRPEKTYNLYSLAEFEKKFSSYPWRKHLLAAGIDLSKVHELNVMTPSALEPLAQLVKSTPLETWKRYLSYHLVKNHAPLLGQKIDDTNFEFFGKVLAGQREQRARWKRAVNLVGAHDCLGEALGKLYVERYFSASAKAQMLALVGNLRIALRQRIEQLDWMGQATKQEALKKLAAFRPKIAYPDKWRDFSALTIVPGDLMGSYRAVRKYWHEDRVSRLGKPTDRDEWQMTPQTVNAYYDAQFNEIVFPAAILQPPFFDPHADLAVNYGAIGGVIGHEMGHGFDDEGSKFDAKGVQRNWWTDADRKTFDARSKVLVEQFSQYEPLPGHKLNGELTLGENIGDLAGLSIALLAYRIALAGKQAPVLEGFTGEQRFFLSWAQVWKGKTRDEFALQLLKSDPHSPGLFRVDGVVRNVDAWYTAFGVGPTNALYLAPSARADIW